MRALLMAGKSKAPITQPGIYRNASKGVISLSSDGTNWLTIADKNLGATQVYNDGDTLSQANCGNYYQWGNNYGFPFTGAVTTSSSQVDASIYGPLTYYSSSTFIVPNSDTNYRDWSSIQNHNLWGGVTDTNDSKRGPCAEGYHIPSRAEFSNIYNMGIDLGVYTGHNDYVEFPKVFKIPLAGNINWVGNIAFQGERGYYWSAQEYYLNNHLGGGLYVFTNAMSADNNAGYKAQANPIRPFKNDPVTPDSNWTVLYQGTGDAGIYHNATLGLISISSDGTNWITIADKNLGATQVYNDGDTLSEANCGKYYQWGNNYGFPFSGSVTTSSTQVSTVGYGGIGYYSSSTFIKGSGSPNNWSSVNNGNLWGSYGDVLTEKGPCGDGYHVPTKTEWQNLYNIGVSISAWTSSGGNNFKTYLKIPFAGRRVLNSSNIANQDVYGYYWASSFVDSYYGGSVSIGSSNLNIGRDACTSGCSIRPFANTPIQPDSSWEVLYQYDPYAPVTTAGIYHDEANGLISISSDGANRVTIADKNLGATQVYNYGDTLSETNCGKYYQWGNCYGFPFSGPTQTSGARVNVTNYGPGLYYIGIYWITATVWMTTVNYNLWGGVTGTVGAKRGPCGEGYHVPSKAEWQTIYNMFGSSFWTNTNTFKYLKLPAGGQIRYTGVVKDYANSEAYYWAADYNTGVGYPYGIRVNSYGLDTNYNDYSGSGFNIRPFKNTAVQPTVSWTKLY